MPHSTDGYAGFHSLPAPGRGGSQDTGMLGLLKQSPLIRAMAPERQAVRAVLPAEDRMDMSHPQAVQAAQNRMKALGVDKIAGVLTTDEVYAAARRTPDYEVLRKRMEARRDGRDPDDVAKVGPDRACPKCGSDDIRIREAHADTGMDEMEGTCRKCDHRDDADKFRTAEKTAALSRREIVAFYLKRAAMDAAPDGGENHPPLLSNPFLGDPKNEPEYANGYAYAQALGHQQLNVATDGDVQRWTGAAPAWTAGFCSGARSLGVGRLADTIEAYKPTAKLGAPMDDLDINDSFATEALTKTAGPLMTAGTTLLGAGLGGMLGSEFGDKLDTTTTTTGHTGPVMGSTPLDGGLDHGGSDLQYGPIAPAHDEAPVVTHSPGPVTQLGHIMHALPYVGAHLPMSDQALGGAAVGAGAGLAGGLALGRLTDREERRPTIAAY